MSDLLSTWLTALIVVVVSAFATGLAAVLLAGIWWAATLALGVLL